LDRQHNLIDEPDAYGPVYRAIERALWALGPALILFMLLNVPSIRAGWQQQEAELSALIATENAAYCTKWGVPAGSPAHLDCLRDVIRIRAETERRVRDELAAAF